MSNVVWTTELLALLHAPPTPENYKFLNQWATREHNGGPALSDGSNNPFFTTAGAGGTVGPFKSGTFPTWNSIGVARYPNLEVGVGINAYHIASEYPAIAGALRSGNPAASAGNAQFQAELTRWSGGGYAGFASIPAAAGPVGPTVDPLKVSELLKKAAAGMLHSASGPTDIPSGSVASGAAGVVKSVGSVGEFLGRLTDPSYLLRGLQIVAGGALVGVGTVLLARQIALTPDLPKIPSAAPPAAVE